MAQRNSDGYLQDILDPMLLQDYHAQEDPLNLLGRVRQSISLPLVSAIAKPFISLIAVLVLTLFVYFCFLDCALP